MGLNFLARVLLGAVFALSVGCNNDNDAPANPTGESKPDSVASIPTGVPVGSMEASRNKKLGSNDSPFSRSTGVKKTTPSIEITLRPSKATYGEEIEISIEGLPRRYPLPFGVLKLANLNLPIPGWYGVPGAKPVTDSAGAIVFKTHAHEGTPSGSQTVTLNIGDMYVGSANLDFRGAALMLPADGVVANQTITIVGSDFTPSSVPGGTGQDRLHQITGMGPSVMMLGGVALEHPYVDYPITLDEAGNLSASITVPATDSTTKPEVWLSVTDSGGRVAHAHLNISRQHVQFKPKTGYPGELVYLSGTGFRASNSLLQITNAVDIVFRYLVNPGTKNEYPMDLRLGRAEVDQYGRFSTEFLIPKQAQIPSANEMVLTPLKGDPLTVRHIVPQARISVEPTRVYHGDEIVVTARGLPANYTLPAGYLTIEDIRVPIPGYLGMGGDKPVSDSVGTVTFVSALPREVPTGNRQLHLLLPGGSEISTSLTALSNQLRVTPNSAALNETIVVSSNDFGYSGGRDSGRIREVQIVGDLRSFVHFDGDRLVRPHVHYPIAVKESGAISFPLRIPVNESTIEGGSVEIGIIDSRGRRGTANVSLKTPTIQVSPAQGDRGSSLTVYGEGFIAGTWGHFAHQADVEYAGIGVATAQITKTGSFEARFNVPQDAPLGSANLVTAQVRSHAYVSKGGQSFSFKAKTEHTTGERHVSVNPMAGPAGSELKITGSGFLGFVPYMIQVGHVWVVPPPVSYTDKYGNLEVLVPIPRTVTPGKREVKVQIQGESFIVEIEVTE